MLFKFLKSVLSVNKCFQAYTYYLKTIIYAAYDGLYILFVNLI